jgi:hypothetical protein
VTEHRADRDRDRAAAPVDIAGGDIMRLVLDENPITGFR